MILFRCTELNTSPSISVNPKGLINFRDSSNPTMIRVRFSNPQVRMPAIPESAGDGSPDQGATSASVLEEKVVAVESQPIDPWALALCLGDPGRDSIQHARTACNGSRKADGPPDESEQTGRQARGAQATG